MERVCLLSVGRSSRPDTELGYCSILRELLKHSLMIVITVRFGRNYYKKRSILSLFIFALYSLSLSLSVLSLFTSLYHTSSISRSISLYHSIILSLCLFLVISRSFVS